MYNNADKIKKKDRIECTTKGKRTNSSILIIKKEIDKGNGKLI